MSKHLFARICRASGRLLLTVGAILCLGFVVMNFSPFHAPSTNIANSTAISSTGATALPTEASSANPFFALVSGLIVSAIIVAAAALCFRAYNDSIRAAIAKVAHALKLNIHTTELILATFIWAIANLILLFNSPILALIAFPALIINDLLFIFAWTSYGCPVYVV